MTNESGAELDAAAQRAALAGLSALFEQSSFGTEAAASLRHRATAGSVDRILQRTKDLASDTRSVRAEVQAGPPSDPWEGRPALSREEAPQVESVELALRRGIVSGEFEAGEKLVEVVLADRYGVSRNVIRVALRRLEQDDVVQRDGRRVLVRQHWATEIMDIYEVRIILETAAARAAALRRTPREIGLLTGAFEAMRAVNPYYITSQEQVCWAFHELIWTASHSQTLASVLHRLQVDLRRYPAGAMTSPSGWGQLLADYQRLVAAVREHHADDAAEIIGTRLRAARDLRVHDHTHPDISIPDWSGGGGTA